MSPQHALVAVAAAAALAAPAIAHVTATSTPAANATVRAPRVVTLSFSGALIPARTATDLVMTAMPGVANHGEMTIRNYQTAWSDGNRTLTLTLRQPLRTGTYELRWRSTGADGHAMTGKVPFIVK